MREVKKLKIDQNYMQKFIHFIKYNNATVIMIAIILVLGGGVFAAGPDAIGQKISKIQGIDNTLLIQSDLDNMNVDFKIQNIEQDNEYYYVTYTYLDLTVIKQAWQYQLNQKTVKVSKKIKQDISVYMTKYLAKHYEARIRELKKEKDYALASGEQKRIKVTEYTGLIGKTLDLTAEVFQGYEPIKKVELPTPENLVLPFIVPSSTEQTNLTTPADSMSKVYNEYIATHDPDHDNIFDSNDNCPNISNSDQLDTDSDGIGNVCDNSPVLDFSTATSTASTTDIVDDIVNP